jgi:trigger factor
VKDYKGLEFKKEDDSVSDEDFNNTLNQYLGSKAEMKEIEDKDKALENGLFAVMNFEGEQEDGEKPENMAGKEFLLEIGSNQFIPGFEEQMVGMKAGEKKTIEVTFPETYHEETLKGRPAKFMLNFLR